MALTDKYDLIIHSGQYSAIQASFRAGRASHAYIIEGAEGAGKRSMADVLAAAFLCKADTKPCFTCSECRRVFGHVHPDVHFYSSAKKTIPVDDMRELIQQAGITPYEGGNSVTIINDMHTATPEAQNCLLKTLEEPRSGHIFILLAQNAQLLLETIRSRCRLIRLTGFPSSQLEKQLLLYFEDPVKCRQAAQESGGIIGNAINIMNSDRYWQLRSVVNSVFKIIGTQGQAAQISSLLQQNKDDIQTILDIMLTLLAQMLDQAVNSQKEETANISGRLQALSRIKFVQDAQYRLKCNVNFGLTIDTLALNLIKGEKTWQRS